MDGITASFIIASSKPRDLAEFYASVCNETVSQGFVNDHYLIIYRDLCKIQIYKPSHRRSFLVKGSQSCVICFQKEPNQNPLFILKKWCKEIISFGAKVYEEPILETFGAEAWILDPDGNRFVLFVPLKKSINQRS